MPVTLKDIALLIGISRQAVAAALEGDGSSRVSEATRAKVIKLARELNYVPNLAARNLRGGKSKTIGILNSTGTPFPQTVYGEVCQILRSLGYTTLTVDHALGELPQLCSQLASCGCQGIIIMDYINTPGKMMVTADLPVVVCRTKFGYSDIDVDKEMVGFAGTAHLLEHGHKEVWFLTGKSVPASRREHGWARALKEYGAHGRALELQNLEGSAEKVAAAIKERKITALFCSNDFIAGKTMRALQSQGLRVPQDVAIVGCDGHSFVEFTVPSITTVIQPVHELAQRCVEIVLERIEKKINGIVLEREEIQPRLWIGGSCGCPDRVPHQIYQLNTTGNLEKDYRLNFNSSLWSDEIQSECNRK